MTNKHTSSLKKRLPILILLFILLQFLQFLCQPLKSLLPLAHILLNPKEKSIMLVGTLELDLYLPV